MQYSLPTFITAERALADAQQAGKSLLGHSAPYMTDAFSKFLHMFSSLTHPKKDNKSVLNKKMNINVHFFVYSA